MERLTQRLKEIWRMFLRRFWVMVIVAGFGVGIAAFVADVAPPVYEAEATMLVENPQVPEALVQSTVTTGTLAPLSVIRQKMMTSDNLQTVIEDLELFQNRSDLSVSQKAETLRAATSLEPINLQHDQARDMGDAFAYVIRVRFPDADKAADIANRFAANALAHNLKARKERAAERLLPLRLEEERLSRALIDIENRLSVFRNDRKNSLPETLQARRDELEQISQNAVKLDQDALALEEERSGLVIQIQQLSSLTRAESPEAQQLRRLELQLARQRAIFAESHRVVKRLKTEIATLTAAIEANGDADDSEDAQLERLAQGEVMARRVQVIETRLEALNDKKVALENRRIALEDSIAKTPDTETRLNALSQRQTELEDQYAAISRKRVDAETGQGLEDDPQAERLKVIEKAQAADQPVSPNRPRILALGSGVAMLLAVGLALLLELMNPAIRSAAGMERKLELRPVATIPYISTKREKSLRRIKFFALVLLGVVAVSLIWFLLDAYERPIQLLAQKVMEDTGLAHLVRGLSGDL